MEIPLSEAIEQIRVELQKAVLAGKHQDIVFTATGIELELGVTFNAEAKAGGGFKLMTLLDLSVEGKLGRESQHKVKLSLSATGSDGQPLHVRSNSVTTDLPK